MVRLRGPCFSLAASGSVADALTFSHSRQRPYAKRYATPTNPRTPAQTGRRSMMGFLQQQWTQLSDAQRNTWENVPNPSHLHAYHLFVQYNLVRWTRVEAPSKLYPAAEALMHGSLSSWAASTTLPAAIRLRTTIYTLNYNWGVGWFRSTSTGFDQAPANCVHIHTHETSGAVYWTDAPLQPGTYYYRIILFSEDGKMNITGGERVGIAL